MITIGGAEYVTTVEGAAALRLKPSRLWDWQRRGLIDGLRLPDGSRVYRMTDLWTVERDTRLSRRGRRRTAA